MSQSLYGVRCFVPYIEGIRFSPERGEILPQPSRLAAMLAESGADVVPFRIGRIVPLDWDIEILTTLSSKDWLVFSSANGVHAFFRNLCVHAFPLTDLPPVRIAAVGKKTAKVLQSFGFSPDLIPQGETGAALGQALSQVCKTGSHVLWLSAEKTGAGFETNLNPDIALCKIPCYRNASETVPLSDSVLEQIGSCTASFFTSASAAARSHEALSGELPGEIYSIGPECTAKLHALGVASVLEAESPSYESLIACFSSRR